MIDELKYNPLNLQATSVYNFNEFTLQELLNRFFQTINECVDSSNKALSFLEWLKGEGLSKEVKKYLDEMYNDGRLEALIDEYAGGLQVQIDSLDRGLDELTIETHDAINGLEQKVNLNKNNILDNSRKIDVIAIELNPLEFVGNDITESFKNAINIIKTNESTEGIPNLTTKGEIKLPPGKYLISSTITIPTNIKVTGNGKNTTILTSNITNGTPVIEVTTSGLQSFHNNLEGFTINGNNKNCIGLSFKNVSRWTIKDIMINETLGEGLKLYESYLGEMYSILIRGCGDETRYSMYLDGRDMNNGTHAITMIGGEIAGHPTKNIIGGLNIHYGTSNSLLGTTIEAFKFGVAIYDEGISNLIKGCYFEANKCNLKINSEALTFANNFMAIMTSDTDSVITVEKASAPVIKDNAFKMNPNNILHIKKETSTSTMTIASIKNNLIEGYNLKIEEGLFNKNNSIIEQFDGGFRTQLQGQINYTDDILLNKKLLLGNTSNSIEKNAIGDILFTSSGRFILQKTILTTDINFSLKDNVSVGANSIFVDSDGKLKFKNQFSVVKTITLED